MDPDSFRCGRTKIMFRAGMLSQLEEIREGALSKIIIKMQCQARRVLVHVTYQAKIAEKKVPFPKSSSRCSAKRDASSFTLLTKPRLLRRRASPPFKGMSVYITTAGTGFGTNSTP